MSSMEGKRYRGAQRIEPTSKARAFATTKTSELLKRSMGGKENPAAMLSQHYGTA